MKSHFNFTPEPGAEAEVSLADLPPGSDAVVVSVHDGSPAARRLGDLGLLPDTPVRVLRRAPLGDPVVYELRGYQLCLRRKDAALVRIRRSPAPAGPAGA